MTQVGACIRCGAPMWVQSPWWGVTPPPVMKSCGCVMTYTYTTAGPRPDQIPVAGESWDHIGGGYYKRPATTRPQAAEGDGDG